MRSHQVDYYLPRDGELAVHGLRPGSTFQVELCDGLDQVLASAPVAMGEDDQSIVLAPAATASLTCLVEAADGGPVELASITVRGSGPRGLYLGDEEGLASVGPLETGSYTITAKTKDGRAAIAEDVVLVPGANELRLIVD
jgi:hypothetical protein